jgi:hypothetical protein
LRDFYTQTPDIPFSQPMRVVIFVSYATTPTHRKNANSARSVGTDAENDRRRSSKTFVGLARKHSDDQYTKTRWWRFGIHLPGGNCSRLRKSHLCSQEGEVSADVESGQGFHILWATDYEQTLKKRKSSAGNESTKEGDFSHKGSQTPAKQLNIVYLFDP